LKKFRTRETLDPESQANYPNFYHRYITDFGTEYGSNRVSLTAIFIR